MKKLQQQQKFSCGEQWRKIYRFALYEKEKLNGTTAIRYGVGNIISDTRSIVKSCNVLVWWRGGGV